MGVECTDNLIYNENATGSVFDGGRIMRKAVTLLIAVLLLCPCLTVCAAENAYRLDDLGLSVDIPSDLIVFTRNIKHDDPNLKEFGLTKDQVDSMMKDGNIFLNALDPNVAFEVVVTMIESPLNDFYYLSNTELSVFASTLADGYEGSGMDYIKSEIYEHPQAKFIKIYIKQPSGNGTAYGLQYYTVYDGKAINFTIHSYSGSLTSKNEALIRQIVDSVVFDISPQKEAKKETPPFTYTDPENGTVFTVPANWEQGNLSKERETLDVIFSSTQESGCSIMYGSVDVWAATSAEDRKGYTRADIDNSIFSKEDIAEINGIPVSQVELITLGGHDYYKATTDKKSDVYGISVALSTTTMTRIENGIMYTFYFTGDTSSAQYSEFEELVSSAIYPTTTGESGAFSIIPIVAVVFVAVAVVILVAKKKKTIENSAPIQAPTSSLTTAESVPVKSPASNQATEGALFCHMCGTRLPAGSDFCYKCGAKVIKE